MEKTRPRGLGPEEAEQVLRRAADLDRTHARTAPLADPPPRLDEAELARVAAESGLSVEAMRRALVELEGGALSTPAQPAHFVTGPAVVAERVFAEPPALVEERLERALRGSGLEPVQRAPHATRWEPARGVRHTLGRAVNLGGSAAWIGSTVESGVHAAPGQRTSAELRGDARQLGAPIATVTGLMLSFPAGVALLIVLAFGLRWGFTGTQGLAALLVLAAWAGLTALIARGVARKRVKKLQRKLARVLEEAGAGLAPLRHLDR